MTDKKKDIGRLSRRAVVQGLSGTLASIAMFERAHGLESKERVHNYDFKKQRDIEEAFPYPNAHGGKGVIDVTYFFREDGTETTAANPAWLLTFAMPPGSSEGVHTHRLGDKEAGSYDEFYYIIEGEGVMEIAGERVEVSAGDNVFTPNGVAHGIENTSNDKILKVYMIGVERH
jgi:uncharacterized RmlC-like cupin family protein